MVVKFRAWDKRFNRMFEPHSIDFETENSILVWGEAFDNENTIWGYQSSRVSDEEVMLMQYTGLKDKNDREIYEGDIVTFSSWDEDIENEWHHKPALVKYKQNEAAFYLTRSCNIPLAHQKNIEVIGNIYENPELLEEI